MTSPQLRLIQKQDALIGIGRELHARGQVPATSGNFSMRLDEHSVLITASGRHKGRLERDDFLAVDLHGQPLHGGQPSAETLLHTQLYALLPWVDTVLHCHSPNATVLSRLLPDDVLRLCDYELLKAFRGIETHAATLTIPIFANTQHIPTLAREVETWLQLAPDTPAYLIRGHGVYCWGASADECLRQLEALDFLLDCELRARR
jgi:methylthioribulose-1-phosphate dehydratase